MARLGFGRKRTKKEKGRKERTKGEVVHDNNDDGGDDVDNDDDDDSHYDDDDDDVGDDRRANDDPRDVNTHARTYGGACRSTHNFHITCARRVRMGME